MRRSLLSLAVMLALSLSLNSSAMARQKKAAGQVIVPQSSVARAGDAGKRVHTNLKIFVPSNPFNAARRNAAAGLPPFPGYPYETPASAACIYGLVFRTSAACNPNVVSTNPTGGSRAIAIVDAYHYPQAADDLATFSSQFGLPAANFETVFASGVQPPEDSTGGWELEEALDIEWAHAMAPNAKIYLVEANSNSFDDMFAAVDVASSLVSAAGGGEVSMSWSSGEFTGETDWDTHFQTPGVVYISSSGDGILAVYPSVSQFIVSAGGTTVNRDANFNFRSERNWDLAGSGPSFLVSRPFFQDSLAGIVHNQRGTPDLSFDSDPNTGVWVYATNVQGTGWWIFGGTSVAAPALSGVINTAGHFYNSSQDENSVLYGGIGSGNFRDITQGRCWIPPGLHAGPGWDFCTGVGSPRGYDGK